MEWRFKKLTRNDTLQNSSHLEFFHNEALHSAVDALAREDIQNRLDARGDSQKCVEVRYTFAETNDLDYKDLWFRGLADHLSSPHVAEEIGYTPSIRFPITWLVIEDFNTTGLEGDPGCFQDPPTDTVARNDFFWFIRNVGRSGKKGGDRGRWGLGKIVYPAASKVRSFFAYSVRGSDLTSMLIGRSVLAVHNVNDEQFDSEGYFGNFNDSEHIYFATPESGDDVLSRFRSDFGISRRHDEPGLSLVIPWPEENITSKGLIKSLIEHWFWVILDGRLKVSIKAKDNEEVVISSQTIESVIKDHIGDNSSEAKSLLLKIEFAREVQGYKEDQMIKLSLCPIKYAPKWDMGEERFESRDLLENLGQRYRNGELVGFNIPVAVERTDGTINQEGLFKVYLKCSNSTEESIEAFLRDGLTISGLRFLRESGVFSIVKSGDISDDALGTLLGDAENPAHTRWERGGKHFRKRYRHGAAILSYVQRSAASLCSLLTRREEGIDKDLLKDLFSVPDLGIASPTGPKPKVGPDAPPIFPELASRKYFIECNKSAGGFRLRPHPKAEQPPIGIHLKVAYEVVRGSPFKLFHPADFDFTKKGSVNLELSGLSISDISPNRLILLVENPDFEFSAAGFDPRRDLIVDVRPLHDLLTDEESENIDDQL